MTAPLAAFHGSMVEAKRLGRIVHKPPAPRAAGAERQRLTFRQLLNLRDDLRQLGFIPLGGRERCTQPRSSCTNGRAAATLRRSGCLTVSGHAEPGQGVEHVVFGGHLREAV